MEYQLQRFLDAQNHVYLRAFEEVRSGRKSSHWMWYIFPQIAGLGQSDTSKHYAIRDIYEAEAYLKHPVLGTNLLEISVALLALDGHSARAIFGSPDDMKLQSCMTLFQQANSDISVFKSVLDKYFGGEQDAATLHILSHTAQAV